MGEVALHIFNDFMFKDMPEEIKELIHKKGKTLEEHRKVEKYWNNKCYQFEEIYNTGWFKKKEWEK